MTCAKYMQVLCLAGRIILENGGETYRAEDTVLHMARALGLTETEAFAVPSGLFISFTDESGERHTSVARVHLHGTHFSRVDRVNQISRRLADGLMESDELHAALHEAAHLDEEQSCWYAALMALISAAGFAVMFGGGWVDMLVGGLCAALTQLTPRLLRRDDPSVGMASVLLGGVECALIPLAFYSLTGLGITEAMIAAAIMPLVPGLSMTNAVQDILRGDMLSGVAHCGRAIMVAAMVAGGALIGTQLCAVIGFAAQSQAAASTLPLARQAALLCLASLVAGVGFGGLFYGPRRSILWGSLLGVAGYMIYWLLMQAGVSESAAMFTGTLLAAVGGHLAARRVKIIATVFLTIAIMPLVPGLGLYRAMSALVQGELLLGASVGAHSMTLILMISLGIAFGSAMAGVKLPSKGRRRF